MYKYGEFAKETLEQLSGKGAFLTVKNGDKVNTMTIGWGSLSQYWGEEILIVPVRESRYSFELLKHTDELTVSVPCKGQLDDALKICGTLSGRDTDKISAASLSLKPAEKISTPLIDNCDVYYECKVLYYTDLDASRLPKDVIEKAYPNGNLHRLFFCRILSCHR